MRNFLKIGLLFLFFAFLTPGSSVAGEGDKVIYGFRFDLMVMELANIPYDLEVSLELKNGNQWTPFTLVDEEGNKVDKISYTGLQPQSNGKQFYIKIADIKFGMFGGIEGKLENSKSFRVKVKNTKNGKVQYGVASTGDYYVPKGNVFVWATTVRIFGGLR